MTSNWLASDLEQYGPEAEHATGPSPAEAAAYCRKLARQHKENFVVGSLMLPARIKPHFYSIYAYCRWADDLADEIDDPRRSSELLDWWEQELNRCFDGQATHPVFVALLETVRAYQLPDQPFRDLLSAFRQDQQVTQYDTFDDLQDYCSRSANPVGHLVLALGQSQTPENIQYSDRVCSGLQLVNFWQDVARDYERGRLYLPLEDLQRFKCPEQQLRDGNATPAFRQLMQMQVDRAERYLVAGSPLVSRVPPWLQMDIDLFVRGGVAVIQAIREVDYDVLSQRPRVSRFHQLRLLAAAKWNHWRNALGSSRTKQ
jgi:squalene synthase HpnC